MARLLRDAGFAAEKSSRSGCSALDISVPLLGIDRKLEGKVRADGFAQICGWIDDNFAPVIKRDRETPLVITLLSDSLHRLHHQGRYFRWPGLFTAARARVNGV
jgi:hypothetical protein